MTRSTRVLLGSSACFVATLAGCVDRKETFVIDASGAVAMQLEFEADHASELGAGRVPDERDGWVVRRGVRRNDDGETSKHIASATQRFAPGAPLPESYATSADGAPAEQPDLRFPTAMTIEHRDDGTWYHFRRVYPARPWAYLAYVETQLREQYGLDELDGKEVEAITHDELVGAVRMLAEMEVAKQLAFARAAFDDVSPDAPQDGWLAVAEAFRSLAESIDYDRLARLVRRAQETGGDEAIEREAKRLEALAAEAAETALDDAAGYDASRIAAFFERLAWHRDFYDVTRGLEGETFTIAVEMPGSIALSNADTVKGAVATWTFKGAAIRDRDVELMVSSRLDR